MASCPGGSTMQGHLDSARDLLLDATSHHHVLLYFGCQICRRLRMTSAGILYMRKICISTGNPPRRAALTEAVLVSSFTSWEPRSRSLKQLKGCEKPGGTCWRGHHLALQAIPVHLRMGQVSPHSHTHSLSWKIGSSRTLLRIVQLLFTNSASLGCLAD